MLSAVDRLKYSAERCFDKIAIVCGEQRLTYASMFTAIQASAEMLSRIGVKKGSKVAICQRNSASFFINFYAIMALGGCAVLLNWRLTGRELREAVLSTGCSVVISDPGFLEALSSEEKGTDRILFENTIPVPATALGVADEELFDNQKALSSVNEKNFVHLEPDDDALIFFTGGSTGVPKAAVHSCKGLSYWVDATLNNEWIVCSDDIMFNAAPLFHLGGMQASYFALCSGATLVLRSESFNAGSVLDILEAEKVTQVNLIPQTLVLSLLDEWRIKKRDLSSVRLALLMGGAAREEYAASAFEMFENADVIHPYGMSELAATAIIRHSREDFEQYPERRLSVGRVGLGSRIKLVDEEGNLVPEGSPGRVFGKADCMMKGYLNHEMHFDEEGYFDTGDIMRRDADGYLYYVGRNKLMVKTGGENVYCNEVEQTIRLHPAITDCVVFGLPDRKWGEAVSAAVEPKPGHTITPEEIIEHCRESAAHYKQPRNVFIVEKLPLNPAGKVLIDEVLELLQLDAE